MYKKFRNNTQFNKFYKEKEKLIYDKLRYEKVSHLKNM